MNLIHSYTCKERILPLDSTCEKTVLRERRAKRYIQLPFCITLAGTCCGGDEKRWKLAVKWATLGGKVVTAWVLTLPDPSVKGSYLGSLIPGGCSSSIVFSFNRDSGILQDLSITFCLTTSELYINVYEYIYETHLSQFTLTDKLNRMWTICFNTLVISLRSSRNLLLWNGVLVVWNKLWSVHVARFT